jgi:hypothetical protein
MDYLQNNVINNNHFEIDEGTKVFQQSKTVRIVSYWRGADPLSECPYVGVVCG